MVYEDIIPAPSTLITTHRATYINPRFMPGGYCPLQKFDYGQTYGAFTAKQFQDYRSTVLQSSMTPYKNGGNFPTFYSHNPNIVIPNRIQGRERYADTFDVRIYNKDYKRSNDIRRFDLNESLSSLQQITDVLSKKLGAHLAQQHRENYKDKTGTKPVVPEFIIPTSNQKYIRDKYMF